MEVPSQAGVVLVTEHCLLDVIVHGYRVCV